MYIRLTVLVALLLDLLGNVKCQYKVETQTRLGGLFCPVFTPMDDMGALNVSVIPEYAKYIRNSGLDGVVVADIAGEYNSLSVEEKKKLFNAWVIAAKPLGLKIMTQIGGIPQADIVNLGKYVATIRVDGILTLPIVCHYPESPEWFAILLESLAKFTKTLPIFFDYEPHCISSKPVKDIAEYFKAASEKVPQFKGLKLIAGDAVKIAAATKIRKDQKMFLLDHVAFAAGTLLGYDSFITPSLNLFPELIKEIIDSANAGDISGARKLQVKLDKLVALIISEGNYISTHKLAFQLITGIKVGPPRLPLQRVSKRGIREIEDILKDLDIKISKKF